MTTLYTWDEIYERAEDKAFGDDELSAKDKARSELEDIIKEKTGVDINSYEIPEEEIDLFLEKEINFYLFDEDGAFVMQHPKKDFFALAICYIEFKDTDFAVVVRRKDKELAEVFMAEAYGCWCSQDTEKCILPDYDADAICQICYGDFIKAWLRKKDIPCDEDLDFISFDGYCTDDPPADVDEIDASDWRDERVTYYWFKKDALELYCKSINTTLEEYIKYYSNDDVDCDLLQELEYVLKFTEKK